MVPYLFHQFFAAGSHEEIPKYQQIGDGIPVELPPMYLIDWSAQPRKSDNIVNLIN